MSIAMAVAFQQQEELLAALAAQVEELIETMEAQAARLSALEASGCAITSRRASDAERQRRRRSRDKSKSPPIDFQEINDTHRLQTA